jgi:hypothetical protein
MKGDNSISMNSWTHLHSFLLIHLEKEKSAAKIDLWASWKWSALTAILRENAAQIL